VQDEVSVKRIIGLKTDQVLINGKQGRKKTLRDAIFFVLKDLVRDRRTMD
jgi:hypothetical protein